MEKAQATDKSLRMAVSTAGSAPDTAPLPLLGEICDNLEKAHKLGYSAIEVHTRENAGLNYEKILDTCKTTGMRISAIVTGRLHNEEKVTLIDDDAAKVKVAMEGLRKYVDIAQKLHTDIIIGWIRGNLPDGNNNEIYEKRLAGNIKELAIYAMDKNVRILIEAINRYELNFLNTGRAILDLIGKYEIPNTFVHLDTFHMNIEEDDINSTIRYCADKLGYVHFADSNRKYPGAGHLDFASIVKTLKDINYQGYVSVECLRKPTGEEAARMAIQNIQSIVKAYRMRSD
ncbi:MAG TPA: sugar phosphate isomerase/epimerase family protein [Clostridia bacterium]|nr:sugar phosphate isomerase/epimerase family protein [Clostridia bacterium]